MHDPELEGQIRVTVIATGFDSANDEKVIPADFRRVRPRAQPPVEQQAQPVAQPAAAFGGGGSIPVAPPAGGRQTVSPPLQPMRPVMSEEPVDQPVLQPPPAIQVEQSEVRFAAAGGGAPEPVLPLSRFPERTISRDQIEGLDIPTFIRRQMD